MDRDTLIENVQLEVKNLTNYLDDEDYERAAADAEGETGMELPIDDSTADGKKKLYWFKERVKRHLFFYLYSESAHKFKYEGINLQQRFEHYKVILKDMDKAWKEAQEEFFDLFNDIEPHKMFGEVVSPGFVYDGLGRDLTYESET